MSEPRGRAISAGFIFGPEDFSAKEVSEAKSYLPAWIHNDQPAIAGAILVMRHFNHSKIYEVGDSPPS